MLKTVVHRALRRSGYELRRMHSGAWQPANLRKPGLEPRTVVDVGAGPGTPTLYAAFAGAFHVLLEPLAEFEPALRRELQGRRGQLLATAAGEAEGEVTLNVDPDVPEKSSLNERTALTAGAGTVPRQVPVATLDRLWDEHGWEPPFGLKIDTEGSELAVLRGAERLLAATDFVIAEVSAAPRFVGGYAFADVVSHLYGRGFRVCDILDAPKSHDNEVVYLDVMFRR